MVCDHEMQVVHRANKAGQSFGENALLLKDTGRACRVVTVTDCIFAVISKSNYNESVLKCQEKVEDEEVKFLRSIPYLNHLSKNRMLNLLRCCNKV
jgi:hypothetical protein